MDDIGAEAAVSTSQASQGPGGDLNGHDPAAVERFRTALRAVLDALPAGGGPAAVERMQDGQGDGWTLESMLFRVEREVISVFLSACGGDVGACADLLDVQYHTFLRRAEKAGLYSPRHRAKKKTASGGKSRKRK